MGKILAGILFLGIFFLSHTFLIKIIAIILAIILLPFQLLTVLPVVLIYDTVLRGGQKPLYSIITVLVIILYVFITPYLRKSNGNF